MVELKVIEEKENPFFKRKEVLFLIKHETSATPSKAEITKAAAGANNVDESQIVVDYVFSKVGIPESMAKVKILKEKPPAKQEEKKEAAASEAPAGQTA
jgi:ribosomal protein S24E